MISRTVMFRVVSFVGIALSSNAEPVKLIIDTDMGGGGCLDVDDVAALAIANALADNGEATLLAVLVDSAPTHGTGVVSIVNHYYGRDAVPIGSYKGDDLQGDAHWFVDDLMTVFESPIRDSSEVPSSVAVYRKALAAQPEHSVTISAIGLNTNLRDLLMSEGDEHSSLNGVELVSQKVKHLAIMGGGYPLGAECNLMGHWPSPFPDASPAAAAYVLTHWPATVKITFIGYEVGVNILTGGPLYDCVPASNPTRLAYIDYVGYGNTRPSWDPLTILVAVRGSNTRGVTDCESCDGVNRVDPATGHNIWVPGPPSNQTYLVVHNTQAAADEIDELLCQPPNSPSPPISAPAVLGMSQIQVVGTMGSESWSPALGGGDFRAAWDGDVHSFFDSTIGNLAWTGAQLSVEGHHAYNVSHIEYWPRTDFFSQGQPSNFDRHIGGQFRGITPEGAYVLLATITGAPRHGWNSLSVNATEVYQVEYHSPVGGFGNMGEIALYTTSVTVV